MLIALALSILFSLAVGIFAARNKRAESVLIPLLDVFQSIPILGFFPVVILGVVAVIPGQIGVNLAVIFLIFTSMSWNIAFGVYEAVKAIPQDYVDLSNMSSASSVSRILTLYIPSSLSRIAYNSQTSWAVGLFYLVTSEIFSLGGTPSKVDHGIGVAIINFSNAQDYVGYSYSIAALLVAVAVWQIVFLREFSLWAERYRFGEAPHGERRDPLMRVYSWINSRSIAKLFLLTQGRGVTGFTSSLQKFRRGIFYSVLISAVIFLGFGIAAAVATTRTSLEFPSIQNLLTIESGVLVGLGFSLIRVWYVYFLAVLVGVPLGIAIALRTRLYYVMVPVLEVVASVPAPVLLPVIVIAAAKQGEVVAAVIIFLGMIWYIIFNTMAGIRSLPEEIFQLKRVFHISTVKAWRDIYLPATATAFITGSITAIGAAWNTLIIAEYFTLPGFSTQVNTGVGKIITIATTGNQADLVTLYLAIASMTLLIVAFNLTVWRRAYHYTTKRYAYNR
ncbi:MAG: ABC transporter permease subunit [Thaumarchaeota archaeon]|nr:MAG: ABC transporter permease subunit [Nitrososphaerota archaeon]